MTIKRNSAEGGTHGVGVTTSNSGGDSGDAWDGVVLGAGSTITFDNTIRVHGQFSHLVSPASGQGGYLRWDFTGTDEIIQAFYFRTPSAFTVESALAQIRNATTGVCSLQVTSSPLRFRLYQIGGLVFTSATLSVDTWYRWEMRALPGTNTSNGTIQAAYYLSDSTTAIESFSSSTMNTGVDPLVATRLGRNGGTTDTTVFRVESIQAASDGDIPALNVPWPAVSQSLAVENSLQAHVADTPTLTQTHVLAVQDAQQIHTAESPTLTQTHSLVVADALHAHTAQVPTLAVQAPTSVSDNTPDLIQQKLKLEYPASAETNAGALLQKFRDDNNYERWEDYLAALFAVSTVDTAADAANQFWDAFIP